MTYGYSGYSGYNYGKNNYGWNTNKVTQPSNSVNCKKLSHSSNDTITQLEFSRKGEPLLAASSWDFTIRVWKFDYWDYQNPSFLNGYTETSNNAILRFCFDENCSKIYFGTSAGQLKIFDFYQNQGTGFGTSTGTSFGTGTGFGTSTGFKTNTGFGTGTGFGTSTGFGTGTGFGTSTGFGTGFKTTGFGTGTTTGTNTTTGFGKTGTGFGTGFGTFGSTNNNVIQLMVPNVPKNAYVPLPPSQYIFSGLKWNSKHKLIVALPTHKTEDRDYPHSWIGCVDPDNKNNNSNNSFLYELGKIKIINIDTRDDIAWFIYINAENGTPGIAAVDLNTLQANRSLPDIKPVMTQIRSMPTAIAALPHGILGYFVTTIQGFVEFNILNGQSAEHCFYDGIYREEGGPNKCQTFAANCVAVSQEDRKIAIVCSRNELTVFTLEMPPRYRTIIPVYDTKYSKENSTITACALSPNGDTFAVAYGYDWSKGSEEMKRSKPTPFICVGSTPEGPAEH